ncbi:MFS transporter [Candidatus Roizmanbacteria bacterium]|nr:MFS transporter [Candidatus Roizmanbacteria bacterium]
MQSSLSLLIPLALAQFIASYASSNMNVAISSIAHDLGSSVSGIQIAITLFTLTMAALMIPGSKLTDIWGRKRCFILGLIVYGLGALIAALAQGLPLLIIGYSLLEGIGSALMIPPIYILVTVSYSELSARAKAFGVISGMAGVGAAAGPLIGGLITTTISWRASFILQVLVVAGIIILGRRIADAGITGKKPSFDFFGAVLSALGLLFIVIGILQAGTYGWFVAKESFSIGSTVIIPQGGISPIWIVIGIGAILLAWFFVHIRSREKSGKEPLLSTSLFRNKVSNLGLLTQNIQWLILLGTSFVVSVFLQVVRGYNAIETGLILTPSTIGILLSSLLSGRLAKKYAQSTLIRTGFILTIAGIMLLLFLVTATSNVLTFVPGLFAMGIGIGIMLTASVNVVQSSFPENEQGEISGLSRSISNLGSSLGTAIVGTVLVSSTTGNEGFGLALVTVIVIGLIGLVAALLLPKNATSVKV